jgi:hypothetical protein
MDRAELVRQFRGKYYGGFREGVDGAPARTEPFGPRYPSDWEASWTKSEDGLDELE